MNEQEKVVNAIEALKEVFDGSVTDHKVLQDFEEDEDCSSPVRFVELDNSYSDDGSCNYQIRARFSGVGYVVITSHTIDFDVKNHDTAKSYVDTVCINSEVMNALVLAWLEWSARSDDGNMTNRYRFAE